MPGLPTAAYATDEDVALRAPADFAALCPRDQVVAAGADGVVLAADPWTVGSPTVNFAAQGVAPGMVATLTLGTAAGSARPWYTTAGQQLAVASASPAGMTLRRKGQAAGVGQPAAPAGGLTALGFAVATLGPQLLRASYDLARRFGLDDLVQGRRTSDLYDPVEVVQATVLTTLCWLYQGQAREAGDKADDFWAKYRATRQELDDLLDRVVVHWRPAGPAGMPGVPDSTGRFGGRICR